MQLNAGKVATDSEVSESAFKADIAKFDKIENDFKSLDNDSLCTSFILKITQVYGDNLIKVQRFSRTQLN